ncbi:MAG: PAS domain S-box protein [Methanomassiliicoccales archaeon]|nr:PAS domain S-box protein [Methanomassiliicoccales archaeon]
MIRALCIDDDPALLDISKNFLERDGEIAVEPSTSAMDAMVMLETKHFDVIVCDYQMPKIDGIQFLKSLRIQGRTTPFILFTGKGREDVVIDALNNGADFYLQKGGDPKTQFMELANIIKRSVSQRQALEQLHESEEIYEKLFKDNVESMILLDPADGSIVDANHAACAFYGYSREELLRRKIDDLAVRPDTGVPEGSPYQPNGKGATQSMKHRLSNGEVRHVELYSGMLRVKGVTRGYAIVHDISDKVKVEAQTERINRALRMIILTGRHIGIAKSELEMLQAVCQVVTQEEGYPLAWIGRYDDEGVVTELVHSGPDHRNPNGIAIRYDDSKAEQGPSGRVHKSRAPVVLRDLFADPSMAPWFDEVRRLGIRSSLSLPLFIDDTVSGVLHIYSSYKDAFDSDEVGLFSSLASNLSYSLNSLESGHSIDQPAPSLPGTGESVAALASAENEARLRLLADNVMDIIIELDPDWNIRYVNTAAADIFNYPPNEVMGKSLKDFVYPDDLQTFLDSVSALGRNRSPFIIKFRARSNLSFPWVEFVGRYVLDPLGEVTGIVGSIRDINKRQLIEEKVWETGSKLKAIIHTSPLAILSIDLDGSISTWNPAAERIFGWEEIDSARPFAFLPDGVDEGILALKQRMLRGEQMFDVEVKKHLPDGTMRVISLSTAPIVDQGGKIGSIIVVASDITERKHMEERLIQLNEVLRLINGILRHDTLNELTVLNGSLEMYKRTQSEKFLIGATRAVNRSMEMIKRMKELEKIALSGGPLKTIDLAKVAEGVCKGYMIDFKVEGSCDVLADDAIGSAIDNIVRNATIHGKADRIDIQIERQEGKCFMRIADNGIGIPDDLKEKVFQEGFSHGVNGGTGLGLYLVSKAVERYGGEVWVEDSIPHGATFVISLPEARIGQPA